MKRIIGIFAATVVTAVIILLPLVPGFVLAVPLITSASLGLQTALLSNLPLLGITIILFVAGLVVAFYLAARLWLTYPLLMIENKKAIDSIKTSWKITRGKVWSIAATLFLLLILISVPSVIVGIVVFLPLALFVSPYTILFATVSALWGIIYNTYSGTLYGVLNTIYYLDLKRKSR